MSDLLKGLAGYIQSLPAARVRVTRGDGLPDEDRAMMTGAEPDTGSCDLEGRSPDPVAVGTPVPGPLRYFLDGMQRPRGPIFIDSAVPITYGYVAAAIRARGPDKRMRTLEGAHEAREALYLSYRISERFDDSRAVLSGLLAAGLPVENTDRDSEAPVEHPLALSQSARDRISTVRGAVEERLAAKWIAEIGSGDGWLLVDGSLSDRCGLGDIIGVTKSHGTQYFSWEDQQKVLGLEPGERSGVFVPIIRGRRRPVYSWYLRLHSSDARDPYFGLVRVEVPKSERMLNMADDISRWLLAERSPLSLPDSRWDKMIYPIRDCELYLKSRAPSHAMLDALLVRLVSAARAGAGV